MRSSASALFLAAALLGCGDSSGPKIGPPASLAPTGGNAQTGAAGQPLPQPLAVRVLDQAGKPIAGTTVNFTVAAGGGTVSATQAATTAEGTAQATWTLGPVAGSEQRAEARVTKPDGGALTVSFTANATPGAATALVVVGGSGQAAMPGLALQDSLVVRVTDALGNGVPAVLVNWTASAGSITPSSLSGTSGIARARWTLGQTPGSGTAQATAPGIPAATFTATTLDPGPIPVITGTAPDLLAPGALVTITGERFTPGAAQNVVRVAGVAAVVESATATTITARLPASGFPCLPVGPQPLTLVTGGQTVTRSALLRVVNTQAFTLGVPLIGATASELGCVELPADGGRYLMAVTNTGASATNASGLRVRAVSAAAAGAVVTEIQPRAAAALAQDPMGALQRRARHVAVLEQNTALLGQIMSRPEARSLLRSQVAAQQVVPANGDTLTLRVPRVSGGTASCSAFDEVRARVVRVGTRAIVLEDVANPFSGTIDSLYTRLSDEFDARQYDAVRNNFADPLRLDGQLDNNGRLMMLFTQRVNNAGGIAGFVFSGDLFPRALCETSNVGEIFYGYVPTVNDQSYAQSSIGEWYWTIRATVVHEVKHIASFATRVANGSSQGEESWLEEGTAMIVEEIWARDVFGWVPRGNTGYAASIGCEIRGAFNVAPCQGKPGVTWLHFGFMADWMESQGTRSMLGPAPGVSGDGNFYGSAWLFLRWLLDQSSQPEDVLLRALTESTTRGTQNIQARFGRPYAELLPEWALAVALDDRTGITQPGSAFSVPSWNLRNVYLGLNAEQPAAFPTPFPLAQVNFTYGNTEFNVPLLRGGGAAFFELSGSASARQALEFAGTDGAPLGSSVRISIVRLQ